MEKKLPWRGLYLNLISYFGGVLIGLSLLLIVSLFLFSLTQERPSPYIGIFTYVFFPGMLVFGVLIFLFGMWWESRRVRRLGAREPLPLPVFDLNQPQHRRTLGLILVAGGLLAVLLSLSAYNTYLFTDSVAFCGTLCHRVMEPEYASLPAQPPCPGRLRGVPRGTGSGLVLPVQGGGGAPALGDRLPQLPDPDSGPHQEPAPGAGHLRTLPLAGIFLRRPAGSNSLFRT